MRWPALALLLAACTATRSAAAQDAASPKLTKPPRLVQFVEADYPPAELAAGVTATVVLGLEIGSDGTVTGARVITSGGEHFDTAAMAAVRHFHFAPAEIDGRPAPVRITYRYAFTSRVAPPPANAENFTGTVRAGEANAPLARATVSIADLGLTTTTDTDGHFAFAALPPGPHSVAVAAPGRLTLRTGETISPGKRTTVDYALVLGTAALGTRAGADEEEIVRAPRIRHEAVEVSVGADEARHIAGTQGDTLRVVQNLPGVARPAFGGGQLVVWGAAPNDTKIYVDGVEIPALYHQEGLRGVIVSELVQSIELLPGAYGATWGRGLGGVVNVTTRPLPEGIHGFVAADFLDGSAMVTAAIGDRTRVGVAVRQSWIDRLVEAVDPGVNQIVPVPRWRDAQAEVAVRLRSDEEISLVYLGSGDEETRTIGANDPNTRRSDSTSLDFHRVYARYRRLSPDGGNVEITPWFGRDDSKLGERFGAVPTHLDVGSYKYGLRAVSRSRVAPPLVLTGGLDLEGTVAHVDRVGSITIPPREGDLFVFGQPPGDDVGVDAYDVHIADLAPYLTADLTLGPLTISPGVRFDAYLLQGSRATPRIGETPEVGFSRATSTIEPRVAVRYQPDPRVAWTFAAGMHHQPPAGEELGPVFGTPALTLSRAIEATLGAAYRLTRTLSFEATGFAKHLDDLVVRSRIEPQILARNLVQDGEGRVAGLQLLARQELWRGFFGWVSYTISRSERRYVIDPSWRLFDYDQPHLFTVVASQAVKRWTFGARFRYASGLPRTPVLYGAYDVRDDRYDPVFGPQNGARLPPFYALDLRVERAFRLGRAELSLYLDVLNATFHENAEEFVYDYRYRRTSTISGLPTLAVLGAKVGF